MRTRLLFVLMLTAVAVCATAVENKAEVNGSPKTPPPVNQKDPEIKPLKPFNSQGLELAFALEGTQFAYGEPIRGRVTLKCVSNELTIYNPFFHSLSFKPGNLRVFDKAGKLVSKLVEYDGPSWIVDGGIWVRRGDSVGTRINEMPFGVDINDMPLGVPRTGLLPPGEYTAQFVLFSYVVLGPAGAVNPLDRNRTKELKEFLARLAVIAATKPIPFKIVPK